jgi:nitrite reductase/ring-hydroxylating ferredoxin subunit
VSDQAHGDGEGRGEEMTILSSLFGRRAKMAKPDREQGTRAVGAEAWTRDGASIVVDLKRLGDLAVGGATRIEGTEPAILLVRVSEGEYRAFADCCPHKRRGLKMADGKGTIVCDSGHSSFDFEGNRFSGKAKEPLTRYGVETREGGRVVIAVGQEMVVRGESGVD